MEGTAALFFCFSLLCLCSHARVPPGSSSSSNATAGDELALLSFKSMLSSGPSSLLASWSMSSHYCSWPGVVCGRQHPDRVVALRLGSFNLSGRISPFLGNLSFLQKLDLRNNQLVGQIPPELCRLGRLQGLNLSTNFLQASIPGAMGGCTSLKVLDLSSNELEGEIPAEIGALKDMIDLRLHQNDLSGEIPQYLTDLRSLRYLSLYENRLSGAMPPTVGNLTSLQHLDLEGNMLSGAIPSSLGLLPSLSWVNLEDNNLSGSIPDSFWNVSSLRSFSVGNNTLSGVIPPGAFNALRHLEIIIMSTNQFHGYIPASISNASKIQKLSLSSNFFSGTVPLEVGNLGNLHTLQLSANLIEAKEPKDWEFLTALANSSQLEFLLLGSCKLGGALPESLSNLSTSLRYISLSYNAISGSIPRDIGNLINLQFLDLRFNSFTGSLPSSFSKLKNLHTFSVALNKMSGLIPLTIGNLTELNIFELVENSFSGRIPSTLGNLTKLVGLSLSNNNFTGPIPTEIFNIHTLSTILDVSNNNLEGSIQQEIGNLINLVEFRAASNKLSGQIPSSLGECQLLQNLYLQNNMFSGGIPSLLGQLKGLQIVDLSSNNMSGQIPMFFGTFSTLQYLNISFNSFFGELPTVGIFANASAISIQGNSELCGGIPDLHLPSCSSDRPKKKHKSLVIPIVISLVAASFILALLYMLLTWHKRRKTTTPPTTIMQGHPLISYSQLVKATNCFSATNLLGSGSFGSVYKGELDDQAGESTNLVAVKVLKLQTPGAVKSFIAECEALRNLRHRNLVKIVTACLSIDNNGNDFKAIVYDFMPCGSLEGWLHPDTNGQTERKFLNLLQRVSILLDVAFALDYLHCHGPAPVIHCDLKSSNVLLDADMVAHVGDFGLAKILFEKSSVLQQSMSSMGVRGTIGYAAPEYGAGNMVSTHGDIYSYGILVLEMVTGKRPTDSRFTQELSLREHVELGLHGRLLDVVDIQLSLGLENEHQTVNDFSRKTQINCLISLLRLGVSCSQETPSSRMSTGDIIKELHDIKESLMLEIQNIMKQR
ncbi:receptor kinase-like protein Xa21 isoform X1 [Phragmites australis]|uniref:receptor kinase-like protein Xa21 isoform X1 n=1 Tax=Phragmites australis TaxID=29695 RepID=UPI002D79F5B8|nr:receptor kinase-like protein Xa21 isoform X1 [Phragmites australis]XP_062198034.1 receptor kinase-like protein Xa21 isoform X1 [Phragmites australis]